MPGKSPEESPGRTFKITGTGFGFPCGKNTTQVANIWTDYNSKNQYLSIQAKRTEIDLGMHFLECCNVMDQFWPCV